MDTHPSSSTLLSAAEFARFESYILEIAREAKGARTLASDGPYRFGAKQGLCVYLNGQFHDFSGGPRPHGHGAFELVQHLYPNEDPVAWAIAWLAQHPGNGAFIPGEGEPGDDFKEVEATAYITALYTGAALIDGTPGYDYITRPRTDASPTTRGLPLLPEDQAKLRWIPGYRGEEGLLVFPVTDGDDGRLVRLLGVHITPDAGKSPHVPARITILGARRPGLLRFGLPSPTAIETEGPEKALAARARGYPYVVAAGGVSNIGKVTLPVIVQAVVIARDDDPADSPPYVELWRGATRRLGQDLKTAVTARPNDIAPKDAPPLKDLDDLYRCDPEYVSIAINGANLEHGRLGEVANEAIYTEALILTPGALDHAARGLMAMLRISKGTLDDEIRRRINARRDAPQPPRGAMGPEPWEDPVTDIAAVLDASVRCMKKYVAAPDIYFDTAALWIAHAHLIHREELGIDVTPRLGFQSEEPDSGKTTFMKTVREQVPRPKPTGNLSSSALFRAIHARRVTFLVDEGDLLFHPDAHPDLFAIYNSGNDRAFAVVTRSVPLGDGQFEDQDFITFGAICFTSIDKLWLRSAQSRCIGLPMKPATREEAAKLIRFRTNRDPGLKECGRKFARWAMDLPALPDIDVPDNFVNRIADNWRSPFQIANEAGGDWPARCLAAAQADADGYGDIEGRNERGADGLLDAIWRVYAAETMDPRRLHTAVLVEKLLNIDDGRWRVAHKGKPIDEYYFRTKLKGYVTPQSKKADSEEAYDKEADGEMPPREWLPVGGQTNRKGYHELHFKDAFLRYLGRGLPSEAGKGPSPGHPSPPFNTSASAISAIEGVSVNKSTASTIADSIADRGSASATEKMPGVVTDEHPRSATASAMVKNEQIAGVEPSIADIADQEALKGGKVRTKVDSLGPLPRGAVGRKHPKG